jgi:enoyl-CoA hydratase/carnithine racemase
MSTDTEHILYERQGPVALITMDRDNKLNAISTAMSLRLREIFTEINDSPVLRVAVLAARGRFFCAGADVKEYASHSYAEFVRYQQGNRRLYDMIERNNKPVIVAVQGPALGGGFELALACDAIIAAEEAYFGLPEISLGLLPGGGGTQRLTRLIGRTLVKEMVLTGRRVPAAEAKTLCFVNRIVPAAQVLDSALDLARIIAEQPPLAVQLGKRLINEGTDASLTAALDYEQVVLAGLFTTDDGREGIRAFVEKRKPSFKGS